LWRKDPISGSKISPLSLGDSGKIPLDKLSRNTDIEVLLWAH
jgi:hypothetical protein